MGRGEVSVLLLELERGWELHSRIRRATRVFGAYADAFAEGLAWIRQDGGCLLVDASTGRVVYDRDGHAVG